MRFELFDHLNKHQYLTIEKFYKLYQQRYSLIFKIAENLNNPLLSLSKAAVLLKLNQRKKKFWRNSCSFVCYQCLCIIKYKQ